MSQEKLNSQAIWKSLNWMSRDDLAALLIPAWEVGGDG